MYTESINEPGGVAKMRGGVVCIVASLGFFWIQSVPVSAQETVELLWTLQDVVFDDGTIADGYFIVNTEIITEEPLTVEMTVTDWNISVQTGVVLTDYPWGSPLRPISSWTYTRANSEVNLFPGFNTVIRFSSPIGWVFEDPVDLSQRDISLAFGEDADLFHFGFSDRPRRE